MYQLPLTLPPLQPIIGPSYINVWYGGLQMDIGSEVGSQSLGVYFGRKYLGPCMAPGGA